MLNRLRSRKETRNAASALYNTIVERARSEAFYVDGNVPDTLDGRFELITLHAFLVMRRLRADAAKTDELSQALFDQMFDDMDRCLREMGAGDLGVGRRVKSMASAFYGRIKAYEQGLEGDDAALSDALLRNLYGTVESVPDDAGAMIGYVRTQIVALDAQPLESLIAGRVEFGAPYVAARLP